MKILELRAENVKRIKVVSIRPNGNLVQITGPNGSGKTSVLDAIAWALEGTSGIQSRPIRKGARSAKIRVDLGEYVVTRKFAEGGTSSLTVESADGVRFPSPQAMLDGLLGKIAFDPLVFARQKPREQFDTLRSLVQVDLEALDAANASDFNTRTFVNRDLKQHKATLASLPTPPDGTPAEKIDTRPFIDEIAAAGEHNAAIGRRKDNRERVTKDADGLLENANQARAKAAQLRVEADAEDARAASCESKAAEFREKLAAAEPLPEPIDAAAVRQKLDEAEKINANVIARRRREEAKAAMRHSEKEAERLTNNITDREERKREVIAAAKMPVEGIGFGDGVVLLNGLPFEQASSAEQLRASCAIAMAANPTLRVLRIRDGSLLDENGLRMLEQIVTAADYQAWIECVDTSGKTGVVMEDGHVKGAVEEEQPAEAELLAK